MLTPALRDLVIRTIIGEAGQEGPQGWAAVANVIRNRATSGAWGDPYNGGTTSVITAPRQFSVWNPGNKNGPLIRALPTSDPRYQRIGQVVDSVFGDNNVDLTGGATHYYAPAGVTSPPDWAKRGKNVRQIGNQIFMTVPFDASSTAGTAVTGPSSVGVQPGATASPAAGFVYGGSSPQDQGVDIRHIDPVFRARIDQLRADAAAAGIPTHITSGYRDNVNQAGAYARLGAQHLAAPPGQSYHQFGRAVDLAADNPAQQDALIALADQPGRGIASGAHFSTPDRVHFQAIEGKTAPLASASEIASQPAPQAQPVAAIAPAGSAPIPGTPQNPPAASAGAPGGDERFLLNQGMTSGTGPHPQMFTSLNLFGGGSQPPAAAPSAPQTARPDLAQRVPLDQTPLPPSRPGDDALVKAGFSPNAPSWPTPPPPVAAAAPPANPSVAQLPFDFLSRLFPWSSANA